MYKKAWKSQIAIIMAWTLMVGIMPADMVLASVDSINQEISIDLPGNGDVNNNAIQKSETKIDKTSVETDAATISFIDDNFQAVVREQLGIDKSSPITINNCNSIKTLDVSEKNIESLEGIEYFTGLEYLDCSDNQLETLDISRNVALTNLSCGGNQLADLDVSHNIALTELDCGYNQLESLDVSRNVALTSFGCYGNQLEILDVSRNVALTSLICDGNQLEILDVSHNTALVILACGSNKLQALDVSRNTALTELFCEGTNGGSLKDLDISCNTALETLHCYDNRLKTLDISQNIALGVLHCSNNQLESLDVSQNIALESLYCSNNQLESLDVSQNIALKRLCCSNNNMDSIDDVVGRNSILEDFEFDPQNRKKQQKLIATPTTLALYVGGKPKTLKVSNAKGKVAYKSNNTKVAKVSAKGKVTPISNGTATITIEASGNGSYKAASKKVKVIVYSKPGKVTNVKALPTTSKGMLKASWQKVPSTTGYIVRYSYKKNMAGSKTVKIPKKSSDTTAIRGLKSGQYVYVQVQAYIKDGSSLIKGPWSRTTRSGGKVR